MANGEQDSGEGVAPQRTKKKGATDGVPERKRKNENGKKAARWRWRKAQAATANGSVGQEKHEAPGGAFADES